MTVRLSAKRVERARCLAARLAVFAFLGSLWLSGCGDKQPPLFATLTFRKDGSQFSGSVVRREPNSITLTGSGGDTHTFLYTELADIKYGAPSDPAGPSGSVAPASASAAGNAPGTQPTASRPVTAAEAIQLPPGTTVPVLNNGLVDSSFVPAGAITLGRTDSDVTAPGGKVLIPAGANVTITVREKKVVAGRMEMEFELGSADFYDHHYLVSSAKGSLEPGAVVTFQGAQASSPEARLRGENVHLDDGSLMEFKTATPTIFRPSQ